MRREPPSLSLCDRDRLTSHPIARIPGTSILGPPSPAWQLCLPVKGEIFQLRGHRGRSHGWRFHLSQYDHQFQNKLAARDVSGETSPAICFRVGLVAAQAQHSIQRRETQPVRILEASCPQPRVSHGLRAEIGSASALLHLIIGLVRDDPIAWQGMFHVKHPLQV
jgi:hypothetical protein